MRKKIHNHFPIEGWNAINMLIRPSERRGGAADDMGDLVEFNRPSERRGCRATIHE